MPSKSTRHMFNFSKGINTDASLANFPTNYSSDELNFELQVDGSRRRRKGLTTVARDDVALPYYFDYSTYRMFKWSNVGGDPDRNWLVMHANGVLYFFEDEFPITSHSLDLGVDLNDFAVDPLVALEEFYAAPVQVAAGKGVLIVTGKYIHPFIVKYNVEDSTVTTLKIEINERDFEGLVDGIPDTYQVPVGEETDPFIYNLLNAGWTADNMQTFVTDTGNYPAKNLYHALAFRRTTAAGYADEDGIKEYSTDKLLAEIFSDARAPVGHIVRDAFDTFDIQVAGGATVVLATIVTDITDVNISDLTTLQFSSVAHGMTTGQSITITDQYIKANTTGTGSYIYGILPRIALRSFNFSGTYTVTVLDADNFTIPIPNNVVALSYDKQPSSVYIQLPYNFTDTSGLGEECPYRPTACAWYAGRAWYAGTPYSKWASKIYFSQVVESDAQYGKCYQVADPTSPDISDLVATDGGVFNIPEAGTIYQLLPYSSSLLVFADNGVWQIGPGQDGYFSATSYSIRKISSDGVLGGHAAIIAEGVPFYWGKGSIYTITTDLQQGFLVANNISTGIIDNLYQEIPLYRKGIATAIYDDLKKRIFWQYTEGEADVEYPDNIINKFLVYDVRFGAFTSWKIYTSPYIVPVMLFAHRDINIQEDHNKLCVVATLSSHLVQTREPGLYIFNNSDDFEDNYGPAPNPSSADQTEEMGAYIVTGYDIANSPSRNKYAPTVTVFMKKTETGYTEDGPVRESSLSMQARWNWADNSSAGKWGTAQECYRHNRLYIPSWPLPSDSFNDGQPLVITRNKVRGRGRSLHLKFSAGANKDAHLVGWSTNYISLED